MVMINKLDQQETHNTQRYVNMSLVYMYETGFEYFVSYYERSNLVGVCVCMCKGGGGVLVLFGKKSLKIY